MLSDGSRSAGKKRYWRSVVLDTKEPHLANSSQQSKNVCVLRPSDGSAKQVLLFKVRTMILGESGREKRFRCRHKGNSSQR